MDAYDARERVVPVPRELGKKSSWAEFHHVIEIIVPNRRDFLKAVVNVSGIGFVRFGLVGTSVQSFPDNSLASFSRVSVAAQERTFRGVRAGQQRGIDGFALCWCPPGRFVMGSPPHETGHRADEVQVEVTLTRGFWMAKFEVTQAQWSRIIGAFPAQEPSDEFGNGDDFPVYWINFAEAEDFCTKLTERTHRSGALPSGWAFRLPTEAQWEYACRAGTRTSTSFGHRLGRHQANFDGEPLNGGQGGPALRRATTVGSYPANPWGICDMHGNLFEWCRDWYHARLPGGTDPDLYDRRGTPNADGTYSRVRRGGAWNDPGWACRSAFRLRYEPYRRSDHIGFRVAAVEEQTAPLG